VHVLSVFCLYFAFLPYSCIFCLSLCLSFHFALLSCYQFCGEINFIIIMITGRGGRMGRKETGSRDGKTPLKSVSGYGLGNSQVTGFWTSTAEETTSTWALQHSITRSSSTFSSWWLCSMRSTHARLMARRMCSVAFIAVACSLPSGQPPSYSR